MQNDINTLANRLLPEGILDESIMLLAFQQLRARSVELAILCHPKISYISTNWDRFLGRHKKILEVRLKEIGFTEVSNHFLNHLLGCLGSYNARRNQGDAISQRTESEVFSSYLKRYYSRKLRCECCGYQFCTEDVNSQRKAIADDLQLEFSDYIDPRRAEDPLKPISTPGSKDRYYTRLELDHVVPQSSLGWGTEDNIRILCRFCNSGKAGYLHSLEPYSSLLANSLAFAYRDSAQIGRTLVTTVAALRHFGRLCSICGSGYDKEVTVQFRSERATNSGWFMPCNLQVTCYDCHNCHNSI